MQCAKERAIPYVGAKRICVLGVDFKGERGLHIREGEGQSLLSFQEDRECGWEEGAGVL